MPFTTRNQKHVPLTDASMGARTGFAENFYASRKRQYSVDSALGYEEELYEAYRDNLQRAGQFAGEELDFGVSMSKSQRAKLNERLFELKKQNPEIKTFDEIDAQHREAAQSIINEQRKIGSKASWAGWAGEMAGQVVAGAAFWRDPLYAAGLLFGGGLGRSIISKMLIEGAIGGAIETAQQGAFVAPRYKREGLEGNDAVANILGASIGGALLRGAFEIPAPAFRALERAVRPEVVKERQLNSAIDRILGPGASKTRRSVSNEEILKIAKSLPPDPERDFAIELLERRIREQKETPHPPTREGRADTEAELAKAASELAGEEPSPRVKERAAEAEAVRTESTDEAARRQDPELYQRLDDATAARDDLKKKIDELNKSKITEEDVVKLAQETAGPSNAETLAKQAELDQAVKARDETKAQIEAHPELAKKLKFKRQALSKKVARLYNEIKLAEARATVSQGAKEAARKTLERMKAARLAELTGALGKAEAAVTGVNRSVKQLRKKIGRDKAREAAARVVPEAKVNVDGVIEDIGDLELRESHLDEFVAAMEPDENGEISLGLDRKFSDDFLKVETDEGVKTAREILDEIKEDKQLLAEVTKCGVG